MKPFLKKAGFVVLFACIGMGLGFGYSYIHYVRVRDAMQAKLDAANDRQEWLKEDYKRQKDLAAQARREEMTLVSRKRAVAQEKARLEEERAAVLKESNGLQQNIEKVEKTLSGLKARQDEHEKQVAGLQAEVQALMRRLADAVAGHKDRKEQLQVTRAALENLLDENTRTFDKAYAENRWLCKTAETLLGKYYEKGVTDILLVQKPLSEADKAEFAAIKKDYDERIRELQKKQMSSRDEADKIVYD
ncbi:MAG: hypothetical protein SWC96_04710 [Thermodesulfobacteriota bacterium]|nr:hypothetical protein [Thermodesulfobacteriota bacterium]